MSGVWLRSTRLIFRAACAPWNPAVSPNIGRVQHCCWGESAQTEAPCDRQSGASHPEEPGRAAGQAWEGGLAEQGSTRQTQAGFESQLWGWNSGCGAAEAGFAIGSQFSSVQSLSRLCDPMDCSMPGPPVRQNMRSMPGSS